MSVDDRPTRAQRASITARLLVEASLCDEPLQAAELLHQVILLNRGVAEGVARGYRNRGVPLDDLNQVAYEALTKAVLRFDPALGDDLLSFAVPTIRGELRRYFRDVGWTIRPPRRLQEMQARARRAIERLGHDLGREPVTEEIARDLGVSAADYVQALGALGCFAPASLDEPLDPRSAGSRADLLVTEDDLESRERRLVLAPAVRRLGDLEKRVLYLRYFEDLTQEEIGARLGMTQIQVSRLLARVLRRLREETGASDG